MKHIEPVHTPHTTLTLPPPPPPPPPMKGIFYKSHGNPATVLQYGDLPMPKLESSHDLIVQVHASSINPADWKQTSSSDRLLMDRPLPIKPGFDFSGVIIERGADVDARLQVGHEVCGMIRGLRTGTTCQYLVVNEEVVCIKPKRLTHEQAAAVPLASITAYQCLRKGGLDPHDPAKNANKSVFVTGGPGGVGTFVIQLAKHLFKAGRVVTTASGGDKSALCKRLGADDVVNYRDTKFWELKEKFDVLVDCSHEASQMLKIAKDGGAIMSITEAPSQACLMEWVDFLGPTPGITLRGPVKAVVTGAPAWLLNFFTGASKLNHNGHGVRFDHVITIPKHTELQVVLDVIEATPAFEIVIDSVYDLDKGVDAYLRSASGKAVGKVVVRSPPA